ncbi:unnamed protein product [Phytomonas sp. Hart1]|nr:unnamed protein product [Phytomonas sp. Hart1]|eukprot:CCW66991.1 unnamed protein product [Phytomonas sp. isolate Hart1]
MDITEEESVRHIIRKQFMQDVTSPMLRQITDVQVISPYDIEQLSATDCRYKTLERIVEKVRAYYLEPLSDSPQTEKRVLADDTVSCLQPAAVVSDHWLLSVPSALRSHERDVVNYIGMLVAIDFRHWAEVTPERHDRTSLDCDITEAAVGMEVKGFAGFYTTLSHDDLSTTNVESQDALHIEKAHPMAQSKSSLLLRGSAAMVYLLRCAVEQYNIPWYNPEYLLQFSSVQAAREAMQVCFRGCCEDGVTPLWMPATDERVELLLSLGQSLREKQTSFYDILCACNGFVFKPHGPLSVETCSSSHPNGFISRLLQLHHRYHDFACHSMTSGDARIPILKLSQLTVLALSNALPALWRFRAQSGLSLVSEGVSQPGWIQNIAVTHHNLQSYERPPLFRDLTQLSICCDYQIPRALRDSGLLVYSTRLSYLVDRGVLLEAGGREEGSIRIGAILATELLIDYLSERFTRNTGSMEKHKMHVICGLTQTDTRSVNIQALDYALWYIGRYPSDDIRSRHHLCRTIMY